MTENISVHFPFYNFSAPGIGTSRKLLYNDTNMVDIISLYGLRVITYEPGSASTIFKARMFRE